MKKNLLTLCSAAAALACITSAYATPALRWSFDGGTSWTTIQDGAAGDNFAGISGLISANITLGGFTLALSGTGSTKPQEGTAASPIMDLGVHGSGTTGGGTLIVEFTETDYTPVPSGSYISTLTANNIGVSENSYLVIGANSQFAGADIIGGVPVGPTAINHIGPLSGITSGSASGAVPGQPTTYSITLVEVFTLPGSPTAAGAASISADGRVVVPDGGNTLMLLGSALSVLGFGAFRKARKA